jgi:hypothetical protein
MCQERVEERLSFQAAIIKKDFDGKEARREK